MELTNWKFDPDISIFKCIYTVYLRKTKYIYVKVVRRKNVLINVNNYPTTAGVVMENIYIYIYIPTKRKAAKVYQLRQMDCSASSAVTSILGSSITNKHYVETYFVGAWANRDLPFIFEKTRQIDC